MNAANIAVQIDHRNHKPPLARLSSCGSPRASDDGLIGRLLNAICIDVSLRDRAKGAVPRREARHPAARGNLLLRRRARGCRRRRDNGPRSIQTEVCRVWIPRPKGRTARTALRSVRIGVWLERYRPSQAPRSGTAVLLGLLALTYGKRKPVTTMRRGEVVRRRFQKPLIATFLTPLPQRRHFRRARLNDSRIRAPARPCPERHWPEPRNPSASMLTAPHGNPRFPALIDF